MGLLEGKVVLITGAGGGIGRAHALACARQGARVLVNDLGGARDGSGTGGSAAGEVVAEIEALGGQAVANTDSVTDPAGCARMVQAAMERWGRLDAVVNNAGILRDRTFAKMTPEEWQLVLDVHLGGTFNVTQAALAALTRTAEAHGGAAIVNTTSYSGLIGNFGQGNYGAAKGGIYALTRVLAVELRKKGIVVNALAPIAKTRMTEDLAHIEDSWSAEQVAPVVVYLVSELARGVTGRVFGVQGQRIHAYEMKTNDGVEKPGKEPWTPQEIAERLDDIFNFGAPAGGAGGGDDIVSQVFRHFPAGFRASAQPGWKAVIQWVVRGGTDQTIQVDGASCKVAPGLVGGATCTIKVSKETLVAMFKGELDPQRAFMTGKAAADNMTDLMKMATAFDFEKIGVAFRAGEAAPAVQTSTQARSAQPGPAEVPIGKRYDAGYSLVHPDHVDAFAKATNDPSIVYCGPDAISPPMFHTRLLRDAMFAIIGDPELNLDFLKLVHGEHDATFHRPVRPWDVVQARARLDRVEQKAKGLVVEGTLLGFVEGILAVEARTLFFIRGQMVLPVGTALGVPPTEPAPAVEGAPDLEIHWKVDPDQSSRYALASLDDNPIHTDADIARAAGLPGCILHGLCTMAMAGHSIVKRLAFDDSRDLKRLSVRFSKPVPMGATLTTRVWHTDRGVEFIVVDGDGEAVITNGLAVLSG